MLKRNEITQVLPWQLFDFQEAERSGLKSYSEGVGGISARYKLSELVYFLATSGPVTMQQVIELIQVFEKQVEVRTGEFDIFEALERMANGENPAIPATGDLKQDSIILRTVASAYRDKTSARKQELANLATEKELLPKPVLMEGLNRIADMYQDNLGEQFFRELERAGADYATVRDRVSWIHDQVVKEINKMEEGI